MALLVTACVQGHCTVSVCVRDRSRSGPCSLAWADFGVGLVGGESPPNSQERVRSTAVGGGGVEEDLRVRMLRNMIEW